jgi:hypothetical protein
MTAAQTPSRIRSPSTGAAQEPDSKKPRDLRGIAVWESGQSCTSFPSILEQIYLFFCGIAHPT